MLNRRQFLETSAAGLALSPLLFGQQVPSAKKRLAILTTEWRYHSHMWHMGERFLVGYPHRGVWHHPKFDVVGIYVDQKPENDLSAQRQEEFKFPLFSTVSETVRAGGKQLAVDAVLIIGEHGKYELSEYGQTKYPRYELFKQATDVFRQDGRSVPIFNDKHLSWRWDWAKEMVDISKELKFALAAGSSLPVTWRMPSIEMPWGAELTESMCLAIGGMDSYDFHALEVIQCMAERRKGGETGVSAVQGLKGDAVWKAMEKGSWDAGGWDPTLFEACLTRTQTLSQPKTFSDRHPTIAQIRECRRYKGDHAVDERVGQRLYFCRSNSWTRGTAVDAVLFTSQSECHLLCRVDGKGRRNVSDGALTLPDRTYVAHNRFGRGRRSFRWHRTGTSTDSTSCHSLPSWYRIYVRSKLIAEFVDVTSNDCLVSTGFTN